MVRIKKVDMTNTTRFPFEMYVINKLKLVDTRGRLRDHRKAFSSFKFPEQHTKIMQEKQPSGSWLLFYTPCIESHMRVHGLKQIKKAKKGCRAIDVVTLTKVRWRNKLSLRTTLTKCSYSWPVKEMRSYNLKLELVTSVKERDWASLKHWSIGLSKLFCLKHQWILV